MRKPSLHSNRLMNTHRRNKHMRGLMVFNWVRNDFEEGYRKKYSIGRDVH